MTAEPDRDSLDERVEYHPTVDRWVLELERLIHGALAMEVDRIGGIDEYVSTAIANSRDVPAARKSFRSALERVVWSWHPEQAASHEEASNMLSFLEAFTPSTGFSRLVGFLNKGFQLGTASESQTERSDIHRRSLSALESYFPAAPSEDHMSAPFKSYVRLLRKYLKIPQYSDYAANRLFDLDQMSLGHGNARALLKSNPRVLHDLIIRLLDAPEPESSTELSSIYEVSLDDGAKTLSDFEQTLASVKARIKHLPGKGPLIFYGKKQIKLSTSNRGQYLALHRWGPRTHGLEAKLDRLTTSRDDG
jgi:hypothetical protein